MAHLSDPGTGTFQAGKSPSAVVIVTSSAVRPACSGVSQTSLGKRYTSPSAGMSPTTSITGRVRVPSVAVSDAGPTTTTDPSSKTSPITTASNRVSSRCSASGRTVTVAPAPSPSTVWTVPFQNPSGL